MLRCVWQTVCATTLIHVNDHGSSCCRATELCCVFMFRCCSFRYVSAAAGARSMLFMIDVSSSMSTNGRLTATKVRKRCGWW